MNTRNISQATLLTFHDGDCTPRTLLCHPDVTLLAVQAYIASNMKQPVHHLVMSACASDLSLADATGAPAPKGVTVPMILDLTNGI